MIGPGMSSGDDATLDALVGSALDVMHEDAVLVADAAALHERMQAPFHAARTELEWGRLSFDDPASASTDVAVQHVERARQIAAEHHCNQVERRADRLLETMRSSPLGERT